MAVDLTAGIVRVLARSGTTAGTGFVVTDEGLIATCAHVVKATGSGPGDTVRVGFHATGEEREAQVERDWWRGPDAEDVAILRLDGPVPEGVMPLPLGSSAGVEGHALTTFGFPDPKPVEGLAGKCEVVGRTTERGVPVLQLRSSEVTPGFSGAPVLDSVTRRVVGMITAITVPDQYGRLAETAFITPTETLRAVCPALQISDLCPYRGLAAFTEDHAEFFSGRKKLVADLVDHLRGNPRFLAVVGPSGSGKSSVVQAGLFPALRRGKVPGSEKWHLLTFRPGADPFAALTTAGLGVPQNGDLQAVSCAFLEAHPHIKRLVLFADQFEEIFTLCPQPVQEQFLRQLAALLESNLSVTLVLALRADFYGHLLRYGPLVERLKIGQINVPPMGSDELRAAVEEPATSVGLRFEPGMVEIIVEETSAVDHPLPLLESALTQLWEKREDGTLTHAAYQAVGQVAGAIGQWAEDAYTKLNTEERRLAQRIFTRLVRYSEGEMGDTRQRQPLSVLAARSEERGPLHQLVQRLADARLLVTGGDPGTETVEIIHDALLQQWSRLKHWTAEQREFYLWRQRLDERLQEWEEKRQDEGALLRGALLAEAERWMTERPEELNKAERVFIKESLTLRKRERVVRERRRQQLTLAAVEAAAIFLVLALLAWGQRNTAQEAQATAVAEVNIRATAEAQAEEQRQIAVARQLAAQAQVVLDESSPVRGTLLAVESLRRLSSMEGDQALRYGLSLLPCPVFRITCESGVNTVVFSPDGKWLATGNNDGIAQLWDASTAQEVARMTQDSQVTDITFDPDGHWLATGSLDGTVRVWEWSTEHEVVRTLLGDEVYAVDFSPDGQWLLAAIGDGTVRVWEVATGQEVARMTHEGAALAAAFSPDGQQVVSGGSSGIAQVWEVGSGREIARVVHNDGWLGDAAFSPNGQWVVSGGSEAIGSHLVRVWEAATGQEIAHLTHAGGIEAVAFSPDSCYVLSGSWDGIVRMWETTTGQEIARMAHEGSVHAVAFAPNGRWVVTADLDGTVWMWDVSTTFNTSAVAGQVTSRMAHEGWVWAATFSPDGQWLATGSDDGTARVWQVITRQEIARMTHEGQVRNVTFSPDGRWLATGSWDGTARVWEAATGREVIRMAHEGWVTDVAFSPDGEWLATRSNDGAARLWDAITGQEVARIAHDDWVTDVAFSPDGQWLATGSADGTAQVWEVATRQRIARMTHKGRVTDVTFSPDGRWLATGSWDGTAQVWEVPMGRGVVRILHGDMVEIVAFSPDSRWLATGGEDKTVRVWETSTGQEMVHMTPDRWITTVAFSPDGKWIVSGTDDGTVRVWEVLSGQEIARIVHEQVVNEVAFSPDGRYLATASGDDTARVWLWRPEDLIAEACARLYRNLTPEEWQRYLGDEPYRPTCPNLPMPEE